MKAINNLLKKIWLRPALRKSIIFIVGWSIVLGVIIFLFDKTLFKNITTYFFFLFFYILFSALFSSSETAFTILDERRNSDNKEDESNLIKDIEDHFDKAIFFPEKRKTYITDMLGDNFGKLVSTLLVFNNLVNLVGLVIVSTYITSSAKGEILNTIICTLSILVFGEIAAKLFANKYPIKVAALNVLPIYFLWWACGNILEAMLLIRGERESD